MTYFAFANYMAGFDDRSGNSGVSLGCISNISSPLFL